ncbi:helix-turn-helix domain-containing protein [Luteimonas sp. MJ293]|uniref:helix-turn-helix domain-containing protein n=1 Tax=Luteimonas sp. MJ146 TaxID=3129240 RepID=UPI0031BB16DA
MTRAKPQPAPLTVASAWPDTMGLEQAADYLRLGRDATRALWERGELPGVSLNQKHLVFRRVALDKFLADVELQQTRERAASARAMQAANDPAPGGRPRGARPDLNRYGEPS